MNKDTPSARGGRPPSLRNPPQPSHGSRGNSSCCRSSPLPFHEDHQWEREALRAQLEAERLCLKEAQHRFAVESRELRKAAERDRRLLADQLQSKWEQQRVRDLQQLKEETKKQREAEIRQLLRWKEAELREAQEFLRRERDGAMQQARDLQRQLAKELVCHGSSSHGGRGGGSAGGLSAECRRKLEEVLAKLRWEVDGDQATRIHHLEAELELERRLFLKYILERFEGEPLFAGPLYRFRHASSAPEGKINRWRATGECAQDMQDGLSADSYNQLRKQNTDLLDARKVLEERSTHLEEENAVLRNRSFPGIQDKVKILKRKSVELTVISKRLEEAAKKLQESNLGFSSTSVPLAMNCSDREWCETVFPPQQANDLNEQAIILLAKDQQIEALQKECQELQAELSARKGNHSLLKICEDSSRIAANGSSSSGITQEASSTIHVCSEDSSLAKKKPRTRNIFKKDRESQGLPLSNDTRNGKNSTIKRDSKNESHVQLLEKQLIQATYERNSAVQLTQELEIKVQNLEEVLKNMKKRAERQQELESKHEKTLQELQKKEELIKQLQQAQTEISREHYEKVQFLETQVKELEHLYPSQAEHVNQNPFRLRCFLARHSYDPFNGANQNPEAELPLTAGEYVYVCGEMDEDGFYVGELMDGRRGFVPSNLVEEVAGNDLFSFILSEPSDISYHSFHEPRFSCQSATGEEKSNSPDEEIRVSLLPDEPEGTLREVQAAVPCPPNRTLLTLRSITATSAEITWFPSIYPHLVYLNGKKYDVTKPGIYCCTFQNLRPSTQYSVKVEPLVPQEALVHPQGGLQQKSTEMTFTTPSGGPPHAPIDVQVQAGSSANTLLIRWLPETIHPSGTSNQDQVSGYAVYISGQKVNQIMSPTAGSVSLDVSQINLFQRPQTVSVRTVSPFGESADSVPALIPSNLQEVPSTVLSQFVASGQNSKGFLESEGRPVPAAEDTDKRRSEASLTPNGRPKSKPESRAITADDSSCPCSHANCHTNGLSPQPKENLLKE